MQKNSHDCTEISFQVYEHHQKIWVCCLLAFLASPSWHFTVPCRPLRFQSSRNCLGNPARPLQMLDLEKPMLSVECRRWQVPDSDLLHYLVRLSADVDAFAMVPWTEYVACLSHRSRSAGFIVSPKTSIISDSWRDAMGIRWASDGKIVSTSFQIQKTLGSSTIRQMAF